MHQFEKSLVIDIIESNNKLLSHTAGPFNQYKKLLLETAGQTELEQLVASFQKGTKEQFHTIKYVNIIIIITSSK